jgi:Spy/CpxP family protein refolding chaperone
MKGKDEMKKFIIAASIAIAAVASSFGAAHAQSVVITDGDGPQYRHHHDHGRYGDRGWHHGWDRPHYQRARCVTKTVEIHRHGHTVVKESRMCR